MISQKLERKGHLHSTFFSEGGEEDVEVAPVHFLHVVGVPCSEQQSISLRFLLHSCNLHSLAAVASLSPVSRACWADKFGADEEKEQ